MDFADNPVLQVTFPAQSSPGEDACFFVNILDDNLVEPTENFIVTATGSTDFPGGNSQAIDILDNDGKSL